MDEVSMAYFIDGYEQGYITEVIVVKNKIYGKDPRGTQGMKIRSKVVWALIP